MRDYEFRGKLLNTNVWVYGNLRIHFVDGDFEQENSKYFIEYNYIDKLGKVHRDSYEVDPLTIGQFTGLVDKNGKRIYEFDIVEAWSQGSKARGVIEQRIDGHWIMYPCWQNSEMWYLMPNDNGETTVEIIGNIHEGITKD